MPYQCAHCQSLFFKTLEIRIHSTQKALLYKKRCKRCKYKYLVQRNSLQGSLMPASFSDWQKAHRVQGQKAPSTASVLVSEYTARISRSKEPPLDYLSRLARAQTQE
jgi:DNA-directed RNA polymerase subunit RPC12/RpoP